MAIKKIELNDFQGHRRSILKFKPGVNVIVGNSNEGKSSVVRAILWVLNNLKGKGIIRNGADTCRVRIDTDKGFIARQISERENTYTINGKVFEKPLSIPPELKSTANLSDNNIQTQLRPHYLILDSPGQIARQINSIIKLEQLSESVKAVNSDHKKEVDRKDGLETEIRELIDTLPDIKKIDRGLQVSKELIEAVTALKQRKEDIEAARILLENYKKVVAQAEELGKALTDTAEIPSYKESLVTFVRGITLLESWKGILSGSEAISTILKHTGDADNLRVRAGELSTLLTLAAEHERIFQKETVAFHGLTNIAAYALDDDDIKRRVLTTQEALQQVNDLSKVSAQATKAQSQFEAVTEEAKGAVEDYIKEITTAGVCPTCFSNIKPTTALQKRIKDGFGI